MTIKKLSVLRRLGVTDAGNNNSEYDAGRRDGEIRALEIIQRTHSDRLDHHERRLQMQERITYGLIGAIFLAEFLPTLRELMINAG